MSEILNGHGTVEGIFPMKGGAAGKGMSLKVAGTYYADWEKTPLNKGDVISFNYEEKRNGDYVNRNVLKGSIKMDSGSAPAPTSSTPAPQAQAKPDDVQAMIVAQNSLTNATNIVIAYKEELNVKGDNITSTVKEIASVLAKSVLAGDFYKDPKFDDDTDELFKG